MTAVVQEERAHPTREEFVSCRWEGRVTDWKAVLAAHHADDWPPPGWLAAAGETLPGVSNA